MLVTIMWKTHIISAQFTTGAPQCAHEDHHEPLETIKYYVNQVIGLLFPPHNLSNPNAGGEVWKATSATRGVRG